MTERLTHALTPRSIHMNALLHDFKKGHPIASYDAANLLYGLMRENFEKTPVHADRPNDGYYQQFFIHPDEPSFFAESLHRFDFGPGHCTAVILLDTAAREIVVAQHTQPQSAILPILPLNDVLALRYEQLYGLSLV